MEISIIIVNYKTPRLTAKCIDSIKKYHPNVSYEIIIEDNSVKNRGFAKANNDGIKKGKGKYLLLLNSDTQVTEGSIDALYNFAKKSDDVGAVASRLVNPDGSVQPSVYHLPTVGRALKQYWFGGKKWLTKYAPERSEDVEAAVMASFLISRTVIRKVGLLDEKFFMYFEDLDYCKRIKEMGLRVYYLKESKVVHLHGASGGTNKLLEDSSKKYFGLLGYYLYTFVLWTGQKWRKVLNLFRE